MLEETEDGFSREAVVSSMQKRFESSAYKQLRRSKLKSAKDQAFEVTGGGKNHPGRGGSRHSNGKSHGSQSGRGNSGSGGGRRNGDSGGGGFSGEGACSSSSSASTAKPGGRTCWVCNKQIYKGCGERGHHIVKCGETEAW